MPVVVDDGITLTLHTGDTVTLYEKNVSVAERKDIRKRLLVIGSEIGFKQRQAEKIDKRRESIEADETLNGDRDAKLAEVAEESAELIASFDLVELRAEALSRRFESWDVYATQADKENDNPVALTKDAIMVFCEKPKRAALIEEIVEKLNEHDAREEKKDLSALDQTGNIFTPIAASS